MAKSKKKENLSLEEKLEQALVPVEEQPYEVPENWCWTTVGTIASVKGGKRVPKGKQLVEDKTNHPYIRVTDFNNHSVIIEQVKYIDGDTFYAIRNYTISANDIYISIAGTIGKVGIIPDSLDGANLTENAAKITDIRMVEQKYLLWLLESESVQTQMKDSTISTTQPKLALFRIENIKIPLPPLVEQRRIVDRIESLFAKLDEAKEKIQNVIEDVEIKKTATIQAAFSGKLTQTWRTKNNFSDDEWKDVILGDIITPVKEKYDPASDEELDIPYVGLEHIEKGNGICSSGSSNEVKSIKILFKKGDILYGKLRPYLNKHDVAEFDGMCSTDIIVYRADSIVTARYMNYLLGTIDFMEYAMENTSGINLPRTSEKAVSAYKLKISNELERAEIVRVLDIIFKNENDVVDNCTRVLHQIDLMKKVILARVFRGELGTNNPNEENSMELLKQIIKEP